jgi:hypothetical protein
MLGNDDFRTGQWDDAQRLLDEANELCDVHGYRARRDALREHHDDRDRQSATTLTSLPHARSPRSSPTRLIR